MEPRNFRKEISSMSPKIAIRGIAMLLLATVAWGGMFPVAKATLHTLDAFYMTLIRL